MVKRFDFGSGGARCYGAGAGAGGAGGRTKAATMALPAALMELADTGHLLA